MVGPAERQLSASSCGGGRISTDSVLGPMISDLSFDSALSPRIHDRAGDTDGGTAADSCGAGPAVGGVWGNCDVRDEDDLSILEMMRMIIVILAWWQ